MRNADVASMGMGLATGNIVNELEQFVAQYVSFTTPGYSLAAALWAISTYLHPHFDTFPYAVITAATKRSGKTRFMEVLSFVSSNAKRLVAATAAAIFTVIRDQHPTLMIDEAESMSSEAAGAMRSVLNAGYRRGGTVQRVAKSEESGVKEWPVYCPKVFVAIGDMYDTLMDRSIVFYMVRGEPKRRFLFDEARGEGEVLGMKAKLIADEVLHDITMAYGAIALSFLNDRDEEIWKPLFAVCQVLAPERVEELKSLAVDMAAEKTQPRRRYTQLAGAEEAADDAEHSERLLRDMLEASNGENVLYTADALDRLKALPLAPWRKYRGNGLNAELMASLLSRFKGLAPKYIRAPRKVVRTGKVKPGKVARGYKREDIEKALAEL